MDHQLKRETINLTGKNIENFETRGQQRVLRLDTKSIVHERKNGSVGPC